MKTKIPVSKPFLDDAETANVNKALCDGAISGFYGKFLPLFERGFARYSECKHGVSTTSGTTALHLALRALSIGVNDEVLVSTLTSMATVFAILYTGARPVPVDIEEDTWNINPSLLKTKISKRTKAILTVHLFGHPADMDPILHTARKHNLYVIEDCAEAHGATYRGKKVGSLGHVGCFSFYANKIITTGEGGMLTTNDVRIAEKARNLKNLAFGNKNKFMHSDIGYNYRMTNLQAALGCAQLKKIGRIISMKRRIAAFYEKNLKDMSCVQLPVEKPCAHNVYWMYHIVLRGALSRKRALVMDKLRKKGIETRESFVPFNMQRVFLRRGLVKHAECPVANRVAANGMYLPSGPLLSEKERHYVVSHLRNILAELA